MSQKLSELAEEVCDAEDVFFDHSFTSGSSPRPASEMQLQTTSPNVNTARDNYLQIIPSSSDEDDASNKCDEAAKKKTTSSQYSGSHLSQKNNFELISPIMAAGTALQKNDKNKSRVVAFAGDSQARGEVSLTEFSKPVTTMTLVKNRTIPTAKQRQMAQTVEIGKGSLPKKSALKKQNVNSKPVETYNPEAFKNSENQPKKQNSDWFGGWIE